jgi:hypothetical protein
MNLSELVKNVIADNLIDDLEVAQIREVIYEDGKIDLEEVNALFEMNNATSDKNSPRWTILFAEAITSFILEDDVIDDDEIKLLLDLIGEDGKVDAVEYALLVNLQNEAKVLPKVFKDMIDKYQKDLLLAS